MEKQDPARTSGRRVDQLKVGDYVFIRPPDINSARSDFIYKIASIKSIENNTEYLYTVTYYNYKHNSYICKKKYFKKATDQEYIVAKLKGRLYE